MSPSVQGKSNLHQSTREIQLERTREGWGGKIVDEVLGMFSTGRRRQWNRKDVGLVQDVYQAGTFRNQNQTGRRENKGL